MGNAIDLPSRSRTSVKGVGTPSAAKDKDMSAFRATVGARRAEAARRYRQWWRIAEASAHGRRREFLRAALIEPVLGAARRRSNPRRRNTQWRSTTVKRSRRRCGRGPGGGVGADQAAVWARIRGRCRVGDSLAIGAAARAPIPASASPFYADLMSSPTPSLLPTQRPLNEAELRELLAPLGTVASHQLLSGGTFSAVQAARLTDGTDLVVKTSVPERALPDGRTPLLT